MLQKVIKRHEQIIVSKNHVHRPAGYWTRDVHKFLKYLHTKGFDQAPKPVGFDKLGRQVVSYI